MAKLNEDVKVVMLKGEKGERGEAGTGIPSGGKTGQAIIKASDRDYDYKWGSLVVNDVANATNDGNGNNIVNTYATKTELNTAKTDASNTYLTKTDASNIYVPRIDNALNTKHFIGNGTDTYFKLATLTITQEHVDDPIQFEIASRYGRMSTLQISFISENTLDPGLQSFTTNFDNEFYMKKIATSTWGLYYNAGLWARIAIKSIYNGTTIGNGYITIDTNITPVDSIPSDAIQCTKLNDFDSHKDAIKNAFIDTTNNSPMIVSIVSRANISRTLNAGDRITVSSGVTVNKDNCADLKKYIGLGYTLIGCTQIYFWAHNASGSDVNSVMAFQPIVNPGNVQIIGKNTDTATVTITSVDIGLVFAHRRLVDRFHATLW